MRKKVVIFTYYWPPSGGPAVQRWLSFSNLLIEHNIDVTIITPDPKNATYPFEDPKLLKEINEKIKVILIPAKDTFYWYKKIVGGGKVPASGFINEKNNLAQIAARFVRGNFYFPDPRKNWLKEAYKAGLFLIENEGFTNVVTAGPPHSTHFIGLKLKKENPTINWISDFHDAWTDIWFYDKLLKTKVAKLIDQRMEKNILDKSDVVFTVGEFLKTKLIEKTTSKDASKYKLISMGFDENIDYSSTIEQKDQFIISYTGTMDEQYRPDVIFDALTRLKSKFENFQLRFIGLVSDSIKKQVKDKNLEDCVSFIAYVPHKESINYLRSSNCLLLVSPKVASENIIIPGKIYEYLATQKTIINIGDNTSNTAQIIAECNAGININRNETDKLSAYLDDFLTNWTTDKSYSPTTYNTNYKKYSRKEEVKKIIESLKN